MKILEILKNDEFLFAEDQIESKKVKEEVINVNNCFSEMKEAIRTFDEFAKSQLEGQYNIKIGKSKSLKEIYGNWKAFNVAFEKLAKEEENEIAKYVSIKTKLINNLKNLLETTKKESAISLFDLFENEYTRCQEGHEVIILGEHNANIIIKAIDDLDRDLNASGHYAEIEPKELIVDYKVVEQNVSNCKDKAFVLFQDKQGKLTKIETAISTMEEIGKKVVFFETFKNTFIDLGISEKEIANYEKSFTKQYIGIKKSLQKELKLEFADICNIQVDESQYETSDIENVKPYEEYAGELPKEEIIPTELLKMDTVNDTAITNEEKPENIKPENAEQEDNDINETTAEQESTQQENIRQNIQVPEESSNDLPEDIQKRKPRARSRKIK